MLVIMALQLQPSPWVNAKGIVIIMKSARYAFKNVNHHDLTRLSQPISYFDFFPLFVIICRACLNVLSVAGESLSLAVQGKVQRKKTIVSNRTWTCQVQ